MCFSVQAIDTDGSGAIDRDEFVVALQNVGKISQMIVGQAEVASTPQVGRSYISSVSQ